MEMLVLAVSVKNLGLCIAGLDMETKEYVRIGHGNKCESLYNDEAVVDGTPITVGDVIDVDVKKLPVFISQTENYELIGKIKKIVRKAPYDELKKIVSSKYKSDDRSYSLIMGNRFKTINSDYIDGYNYSIRSYVVRNVNIYYVNNAKKASFFYDGVEYEGIAVTDSVLRGEPAMYGNGIEGTLAEAVITVTISINPFQASGDDKARFYKYLSGLSSPELNTAVPQYETARTTREMRGKLRAERRNHLH